MTKLSTTWDAQGYGTTITLAEYKLYVPLAYAALSLTQDATETAALAALTGITFDNDKDGTAFMVAQLLEDKLRIDIARTPYTAVTAIEAFKAAYTIV